MLQTGKIVAIFLCMEWKEEAKSLVFGLNTAQLKAKCEEAGVSLSTYYRWLQGVKPIQATKQSFRRACAKA